MSKTIILSDEIYNSLRKHAQDREMSVEEYLNLLQQEAGKNADSKFKDQSAENGYLITWPLLAYCPPAFKPITVKGQPLSKTIIDDRR